MITSHAQIGFEFLTSDLALDLTRSDSGAVDIQHGCLRAALSGSVC
jgi:hypothetical protein